jgi:hypothetical protein
MHLICTQDKRHIDKTQLCSIHLWVLWELHSDVSLLSLVRSFRKVHVVISCTVPIIGSYVVVLASASCVHYLRSILMMEWQLMMVV